MATQTQTVRRTQTVKTSLKPIGEEIDKAVHSLRGRLREADSVRERIFLRVKIKRLKKLKLNAMMMCKRVWTI
jgi:hypothetical protein